MKLSFLIPVYNKEATILETIQTIIDVGEKIKREFEIVVCDDASTDSSLVKIQQASMRYPFVHVVAHQKNRGFAEAYFSSVKAASGDMMLYLSADNDMEKDCLTKLWLSSKQGAVVNQYCSNMNDRPLFRKSISRIYTSLLNLICGLNLKYYNGANVYPAEFLKTIREYDTSFSFQAELLIKAQAKYPLQEVGTCCLFNDEQTSIFKLKNVIGVLKFLISKSWRMRVG